MAKANGFIWRRCRARMDITSDQAADMLGITGGALRQIETNRKPASLALGYRAERLYNCPVDELLVLDGDAPTTPDPKKKDNDEPKVEPTAPPTRKERKSGRGPRRDEMRAAS